MTYTVRVDKKNPMHTTLTIFEDHANCGTITVLTKNADTLVKAILSAGGLAPDPEPAPLPLFNQYGDNGEQGV